MKIVVVNGTPVKGVTFHMKEMFLERLGGENEILEFYPKDMPPFCAGCKNCFIRGEERCPHAAQTGPVWQAFLEADLIVFAYPIYALRAPASIKSLLDHFCVHWMVHRPEPVMFEKTAVIITNSIGAPNGTAQRDVATSLAWMGVSKIHCCGAGLMGQIIWDEMTEKMKKKLEGKLHKLAKKAETLKPRKGKSLKVGLLFQLCRIEHALILKMEDTPSLDTGHYIAHGWIKPKKGVR